MINQSDIVEHEKAGFDGDKYIRLQKEKILERISHFPGKLYLEIGGKFLLDPHASRVLPGFYPDTKRKIFGDLIEESEIVFCVNANDIVSNRQLSNEDVEYSAYVDAMLNDIKRQLGVTPIISVNLIDSDSEGKVDFVVKRWISQGYRVYKRYKIVGYPTDLDKVVSKEGYGKDEYIQTQKKLILVTGAASNSGKMSTCLGQVYLDSQMGIDSGYAKYETFPIWNVALHHPVNLAYEAATADIDDFNCIDSHHLAYYGTEVVNYNRDVDAFPIVLMLIKKIIGLRNYMREYKSPTDMGISMAGFCIIDQAVIKESSRQEILRRKSWYQQMLQRGEGLQKWIDKCDELLALL